MPRATLRAYQSSADKDLIRDNFDRPLLVQLHAARNSPLNYFGLPGAQLLDVRAWADLLGEVAAVERNRANLVIMDEIVSMQMPELRFTPHYGEVDQVILRDRGRSWERGGQRYHPWVSKYDQQRRQHAWYFQVVNLDYFGPFLPEQGPARERANALRKLFDIERLDAWGRWVLLITVEAELLTEDLNTQLREYLRGVEDDAPEPAVTILEFLTEPVVGNQPLTATRLIHAAASSLITRAASHANLDAFPRGTILYRGYNEQPMVHLAFEFEPSPGAIARPTPLFRLLKSPLLLTANRGARREFILQNYQPPNLSQEDIRSVLNFLDGAEVDRLVEQLA